ncbi:MAG TPA: hypothetical protein VK501_19460 [Baekduia sp.]|uniref:hypothetical protein n=1 Tax=Baekduia sp. TaxID=2600305 RepID=UPI002B76197E|nr:hypothetical protein [Baekduia sp.]HMJ36091.1 hypothetical protein [Baekduia sp.]
MRRRLGLAAAVLVAVVAGVGSASALVGNTGRETLDGPQAVQPDGQGASLATSAADPGGRQPWAVRVYRSQAGLTCPEAGRTQGGDFGRVDADGRFQPLDIQAAGSCADLSEAPLSLAVNHFPARDPAGSGRAVIFGVVSPRITGLTLSLAGGRRPLAVNRGAFLAVTDEDQLQGASLDATFADGSTTSYPLRPSAAPATAPAGE